MLQKMIQISKKNKIAILFYARRYRQVKKQDCKLCVTQDDTDK